MLIAAALLLPSSSLVGAADWWMAFNFLLCYIQQRQLQQQSSMQVQTHLLQMTLSPCHLNSLSSALLSMPTLAQQHEVEQKELDRSDNYSARQLSLMQLVLVTDFTENTSLMFLQAWRWAQASSTGCGLSQWIPNWSLSDTTWRIRKIPETRQRSSRWKRTLANGMGFRQCWIWQDFVEFSHMAGGLAVAWLWLQCDLQYAMCVSMTASVSGGLHHVWFTGVLITAGWWITVLKCCGDFTMCWHVDVETSKGCRVGNTIDLLCTVCCAANNYCIWLAWIDSLCRCCDLDFVLDGGDVKLKLFWSDALMFL